MTHRTNEEDRVLKLARKYARMKLTGRYVENGYLCKVDPKQAEDYKQYLAAELLEAAEFMFVVMATDEVDGKLVE